ncbi:hypothetical protein TVAG_018210 [Trichomonas vaginalis G3]|uniref:Uncharacterized protein n=1 Tax=Trichomonas vaginalis (strain ATCC PRA-98 / G3) TaxID=412133 RepID=A2F9V7_TRIV3|nr:Ankyrin repeat family [Trichomonas vaginalis G3]EAX98285.1 hypothetical protein TVAG_018210 [Trichomonas vaginalis G3]KAI5517485.1 Ankyrin repeat family [Trichomonas vaginalis G3]|eukprot:XP_001311215.1 hypothetical protein [Trichomonas vaginalis G3]
MNYDESDRAGFTPLMLAEKSNNAKVVCYLIAMGAKRNENIKAVEFEIVNQLAKSQADQIRLYLSSYHKNALYQDE